MHWVGHFVFTWPRRMSWFGQSVVKLRPVIDGLKYNSNWVKYPPSRIRLMGTWDPGDADLIYDGKAVSGGFYRKTFAPCTHLSSPPSRKCRCCFRPKLFLKIVLPERRYFASKTFVFVSCVTQLRLFSNVITASYC